MSSQEQRSVGGSFGLLAASLALLGIGGFVQFDDTSGFGSDQWNLPLGGVALVLAVAGIGVASVSATARLWLGGALGLLDLLVLWQSVTNEGFRFVWDHNEGELFQFLVALGLTALALIATGLQPAPQAKSESAKPGAGRWLVRIAAYLCGTVIIVFVATWAGIDYYTPTVCDDCLDGLKGVYWGAAALVACLVAVVVIEFVLRSQRKQQRKEGIRA